MNQLFEYPSGNSARSLQSPTATRYPDGSPPQTANSLSSADTLPAGSSGLFGRPRNSGLFGKPRRTTSSDFATQFATHAVQPPAASLRQDPFMTRPAEMGTADPMGPPVNEQTPLQPDESGRSDSSKGLVMPAAIVMVLLTVASGIALGLSFNETGYRDGYSDGHLDGGHKQAGCQNLFYWLLLQCILDLIITCLICIVLSNPLQEHAGFLGCMATFRLCAVASGFHILYFSGLQREFCNQFLITWSTLITWFGVSVMLGVTCYLLLVLMGVAGSARKRPPPPSGKMTSSQVSFG